MTDRNVSGGILAHPFVNYDRAVLSKGIIVTFYSNFTYSTGRGTETWPLSEDLPGRSQGFT